MNKKLQRYIMIHLITFFFLLQTIPLTVPYTVAWNISMDFDENQSVYHPEPTSEFQDYQQTKKNEISVNIGQFDLQDKYKSHLLTPQEVLELKDRIGIWDPSTDYSLMIQGHGTGLIPPTEEEWSEMVGNVEVVDFVASTSKPAQVDHSTSPYFPKVRSQGSSQSCTAFAVTYYAHGFYQAREHGWTNASTGDNTQLLSPAWTYNIINKGYNKGSNFWRNFQVLKTIGAARWSSMPFIASDYISWGTEPAWREAPKYRASWYRQTDAQNIEIIKTWVLDGYICSISIDANEYDGLGVGDDTITSKEYNSTSHNHANAIVGYDDHKMVDGEYGAFKVVNSWGDDWGSINGGRNNAGGWNGSGYYWMTYKALANLVQPVYIFQDIVDYEPKFMATWEFAKSGNCSRDATINVGVGWYGVDKELNLYRNAGKHNYPKFMCMDITELLGLWHYYSPHYAINIFLKIGAGVNRTNVTSFKVELYDSGYHPDGTNAIISLECPEVPKMTPNYYNNSCHGHYIAIENPKEDEYYQGMLSISGTAKKAINITVIDENFETSFPIGWTIGDNDPGSGLDYWGNSTAKVSSGLKSGWCAGTQVPIFFEDFDDYGKFNSTWLRTSENKSYGQPWNITNIDHTFVYGGSDYGVVCSNNRSQNITEWIQTKNGFDTSDYSSLSLEFLLEFNRTNNGDHVQVLYANNTSYPNFTVLKTWLNDFRGIQKLDFSAAADEESVYLAFKYHGEPGNFTFIDDIKVTNNLSSEQYDNNMDSYMYHEVNLTKFNWAHLTYDLWLDSENNTDILSLMVRTDNKWNTLQEHSGPSNGWISESAIIPNDATHIGFWFRSDSKNSTNRGAYLDNIQLEGYLNLTSVIISVAFGPVYTANGLSTWDKNINTQALTEGNHSIVVTAKYGKNSNYHAHDQRTFHIDNLPPEPFSPVANPGTWTTDRQPIITFQTNDSGSYIDHYEMKIDDGMYSTQTSPVVLPSLNDGMHNISVCAFDVLGHSRIGTVKVYIDTSAPECFEPIIVPAGWTNNFQPTLIFNTTDLISGIDHYSVSIDYGNFSNQTSPCILPSLSEGIHTIKVRAFDLAGNSIEGSTYTLIDTTVPDKFIPTAKPSTWTDNNRPLIFFETFDSLSELSHYEVNVDNGEFTPQVSPYKVPVLSDGIHNISVRAYDQAGNYVEGFVHVYIDCSVPNEFQPVAEPSKWTNKYPILMFETTDNTSGIAHYEVSIDNKTFNRQTSPYQLSKLNTGIHQITVRAYDRANNYCQTSINVFIDMNAPMIHSVHPINQSWQNRSNILVSWSCSDDLSGIDYCLIKLNDNEFIKIEPNTGLNFNYSFINLEDEEYRFTILVFDRAGNRLYHSFEVKIDTIPPLVDLLKAPYSSHFSKTPDIEIVWECSDLNSGVNFTEVKIDDGEYMYAGTWGGYDSAFKFTGVADGPHKIYVRSWDLAGNFWVESVEFKVDSTKPEFELQKPVDGDVYKSNNVLCEWLCSDEYSGLDSIYISIHNKDFSFEQFFDDINIDSTTYTIEDLTPGIYTLDIGVIDKADNINHTTIEFTIESSDDRSENNNVINNQILISGTIIIIIVVIILVLLLFFKKKGKNKDLDFTNNSNNNTLSQPGPDHQPQSIGHGQINNQVYIHSHNNSTGPQNSISNVSIYPESKSQK